MKLRLSPEEMLKAEQMGLFGARPKAATPPSTAMHKPPGAGWENIPNGKHGGFRRKSGHGVGYEYWYPNQGVTATPHHEDVHAHHTEPEPHAESVVDKPPPGGWRPEDKVSYQKEHQAERAEEARRRTGGQSTPAVVESKPDEHAALLAQLAALKAENEKLRAAKEKKGGRKKPASGPRDTGHVGAAAEGAGNPPEQAGAPEAGAGGQDPGSVEAAPAAVAAPDPISQVVSPEQQMEHAEGPPAPGRAAIVPVASSGPDLPEHWEKEGPVIYRHRDLMPEIPAEIADKVSPKFSNLEGAEMTPHQVEGAQRILLAWLTHNGVLLQDDAGLGKTSTALAAIKANGGKRNLIVVPTAGKENLIRQWRHDTYNAVAYGMELHDISELKANPNLEGTFICAVNDLREGYDAPASLEERAKGKLSRKAWRLRPELANAWDTVTIDECHNLKKREGTDSTVARALQDHASKVLYMSATPFTNISDMAYMTKMGWFGNNDKAFLDWAKTTGADVSGSVVTNPRPDTMVTIAATMQVDGLSIKRTASLEGLSSEFKPIKFAELPPDSKLLVDQATKLMANAVDDGIDERTARGLMSGWYGVFWEAQKIDKAIEIGKKARAEGKQVAFYTTYQQFTHAHLKGISTCFRSMARRASEKDKEGEALKYQALADKYEAQIEQLKPFRNAVKEIVEAFGGSKEVSEIHGGTRKSAGDEQGRYQDGTTKVAMCTIGKGGTGISLHDHDGRAPRVQINLSLPWGGYQLVQLAGRSHRLGTKSNTEMHWFVGDDAFEMNKASRVGKRLRAMGALTAGDMDLHEASADLVAGTFEAPPAMDDNGEVDIDKEVGALVDGYMAAQEDGGEPRLIGDTTGEKSEAARKKAELSVEAEGARKTYREYALARKAGRNIIDEHYQLVQAEKAKEAFRKARRHAQQLRKGLGWTVTWHPSINAFAVARNDKVTYQQGKEVFGEGHRGKPLKGIVTANVIGEYHIPSEKMALVAEKLLVHNVPVNLNEAEREMWGMDHMAETEAALERLHGHAHIKAQIVGTGENEEPVYFLTGNLYPHRLAIGPLGTSHTMGRDYTNGYLVHQSSLPKVVENIGDGTHVSRAERVGLGGEKQPPKPWTTKDQEGKPLGPEPPKTGAAEGRMWSHVKQKAYPASDKQRQWVNKMVEEHGHDWPGSWGQYGPPPTPTEVEQMTSGQASYMLDKLFAQWRKSFLDHPILRVRSIGSALLELAKAMR